MRANEAYAGKLITHGTWDHEIVPELTPQPGDIVVPKAAIPALPARGLEQDPPRHGASAPCSSVASPPMSASKAPSATPITANSSRDADRRHHKGRARTQEGTEFNVQAFFGWLSTGAEMRR